MLLHSRRRHKSTPSLIPHRLPTIVRRLLERRSQHRFPMRQVAGALEARKLGPSNLAGSLCRTMLDRSDKYTRSHCAAARGVRAPPACSNLPSHSPTSAETGTGSRSVRATNALSSLPFFYKHRFEMVLWSLCAARFFFSVEVDRVTLADRGQRVEAILNTL